MGRALWTAVLGIACLLVMSVGWCARTWDTGEDITGWLEDKCVEIAISTEEPSTETLALAEAIDVDTWIDGEQSPPQEPGKDLDEFAGWDATKCWWTCSGGTVTQGSSTTTWTAPSDGGEYQIEVGIEDLPKAIYQPDSGTRDDYRRYIGLPAHRHAKAVEVTVTATEMPNPVLGPLRFARFESPHDAYVGCTTPDTPTKAGLYPGFLKRTELCGDINLNTFPGDVFEWYQDKKGEETHNGQHEGTSPWLDWTPDGPQPWSPEYCTQHPVACKIWLIDTPGLLTGWSAPPPDGPHTWVIDVHFRTRVKFEGRWCSKNWTYWHRELRLYSNEATGYKWAINANQ